MTTPSRAAVQLDTSGGRVEVVEEGTGPSGVPGGEHLAPGVGQQVAQADAVRIAVRSATVKRRGDRHDEIGLDLQQSVHDIDHRCLLGSGRPWRRRRQRTCPASRLRRTLAPWAGADVLGFGNFPPSGLGEVLVALPGSQASMKNFVASHAQTSGNRGKGPS